MQQQSVYNNPTKIRSRELNLERYQQITGNSKLPRGQVYATLCGVQELDPNSEVCQVLGSGFAKFDQFVGIDSSKEIIEQNRQLFPRSKWIAGRWKSVLKTLDAVIGLAYVDTCYLGDNPKMVEDVLAAMRLSKPGTVIFANAITGSRGLWAKSRAGRHVDDSYLIEALAQSIRAEELGKWDLRAGEHVYRNPNRNLMLTRAFVRKA